MQNANFPPASFDFSCLNSANTAYIDTLYQAYLADSNAVTLQWRQFFLQMEANTDTLSVDVILPTTLVHSTEKSLLESALFAAQLDNLIDTFRRQGHFYAQVNPLAASNNGLIPALQLQHYNLLHQASHQVLDMSLLSARYFLAHQTSLTMNQLYQQLQQTYCQSIGIEYMHIDETEPREWLQQQFETARAGTATSITAAESGIILQDLIAADRLEYYLGKKYPGEKRFSLEGGSAFIPLLKTLIRQARQQNITEVILGMAHRGRLNTLVNIFGKRLDSLMQDFAGTGPIDTNNRLSGDVKYHQGYQSQIVIDQQSMRLTLAFNPSHLEIVGPVTAGIARAYQDQLAATLSFDEDKTKIAAHILPITVHGDAAFCGQGVVQEMLNLSQVPGYKVGGTVRIVINNQVGFTTANDFTTSALKRNDARSSRYCTDIAKMVQAPIFHVNGNDPEAVVFVTQLALAFRNKFKRDVIIDLVCYRLHGHNEADEPRVTQPSMYHCIANQPPLMEQYAKKVIAAQRITEAQYKKWQQDYDSALERSGSVITEWQLLTHAPSAPLPITMPIEVKKEKLSEMAIESIAISLNTLPRTLNAHRLVSTIYQQRLNMAQGTQSFDWGAAETLAYATLLQQGVSIRLTGEDVCRGTFFHRHAAIIDQKSENNYLPLAQFSRHLTGSHSHGMLSIFNSTLSEEAVLAFEYGYACATPHGLNIWEAQFGDFANGAQVVIDQFLAAGEQKWGQQCGLVLLLPHGYDGQGPEHSSARLERYLQLCAQQNMRVCVPSTAAQIFHLLRQQALSIDKKPLIILTPKSFLRAEMAASARKQLAELTPHHTNNSISDPAAETEMVASADYFIPVLEDHETATVAEKIKRVIFCSGKIYYDLVAQRRQQAANNEGNIEVALIRIEQLFPLPIIAIKESIIGYTNATQFVWCQEEPLNQGAWIYCNALLAALLPAAHCTLSVIARPAAASTAVGYKKQHQQQQQAILDKALVLSSLNEQ